ncbi:trichohyalin-like isoform X2 [Montipora capricornis]|uniref:trichohyalin-like isoform X2 n=1 Tax=Montipora capricornis TaxID=246305 RepID=UPI0035F16F07
MAEIDESARPSVRQVCQDFMVREDGALAQRLQEEEFGNHYLRNRSERKTVREDVKAAKITYLEEVRNAQILPVAEVHNMEQTEQWLASDLQHKLRQEEVEVERRRKDAETRDEEIAKHLQEKESLKLERARQRRTERQQKEEEEGKMLSEALSKLKENGKNRVKHCEVAEIQTAPVPVGSRDRPVHTDDTKPHQKLSAKGSNSSRGSDNGNSMGEGTVVQLPRPAEGGRLECDRIIMADGTAIDLFDENDDSGVREKAHRRSRERQDEEFARKLQEEENKLLEQDRQAANDRRVALEYQDREFAKELQRREYVRLQKLKRERQLRRAQTVPPESTQSGNTGEIQALQRLPSYEESVVHRSQIPDLLQDELSFRKDQDDQGDNVSNHKQGIRVEGGSFGRDKAGLNRNSRASSQSSHSHSPGSTSLDRESSLHQHSDSPNHSPLSTLEWSLESTGEYIRHHSHRSSSSSTHSASQVPSVQSPITSPDTREAVWERLYEEGDDIPHNTRPQRILERRSTVASSAPSNFVTTELIGNGSTANGNECNIAELIDPTFNRQKSQNASESSPPGTLTGSESKAKAMPLIQPHRRRSTDKKKKDKEKECKQQ